MKQIQFSDDYSSMLEAGNAADIFIQWKGTTVCGDFHCKCGVHAHICNTDFMYYIRCVACGATYEVPHTVALKKVDAPPNESCVVHAVDE